MNDIGRPFGLSSTTVMLCVGSLVMLGCATPIERSTRSELRRVEAELAPLPSEEDTAQPKPDGSTLDGSLDSYLAYAFERSPALRATFEDWRAATHRPRQERRLPEPTITYAGFVRAVETRVGPQRHRFGAMQWFPWPSKLTAGGQAASFEAQAAQHRFEAHALEIAAEVSEAYWSLWRLQRRREVLADEVEILGSMSELIRVRIEVGGAELADLAQVNLMVSRARDRLAGLDEAERIASSELVRVVGAPDGTVTPIAKSEPSVAEVSEPVASLSAEAGGHPRVASMASRSDAAHEQIRKAQAERAPSFGVGVDWIITGQSGVTPAPVDSGKDAVALSLSVKVPLWGRSYKAAENEARARSSAFRARAIDARNMVAADIRKQAARVSDDVRRVRVYETTLLPQAETAFESVLSSYSAGRSSVAELLLAERELVGLRDELFAAQADYGTHVAKLESAVGRAVETKGRVDGDR